MRLSFLMISLVAFGVAAMGAVVAARALVTVVEERSVIAVREALADADHGWASVIGDGLQIVIEGQAPSEALRFRAMTVAGSMVDASRVIDNMSVTASAAIEAPVFAIEILRNDSGISLIGLIPASVNRDALVARVERLAGGLPVADLLEVADYPEPELWAEAQSYSLDALQRLPRSKISVAAGRVAITAISDSADDKARLEADLSRNIPQDLRVDLSISAPRPVIAPYTTRFILDETGPHFDACVADSAKSSEQIEQAAERLGTVDGEDCIEGLGAPSRRWGDAVAMGIDAVGKLGGGTITFSDTDAVLVAALGTPPAIFDDVVGELSNALPDVFVLDASLPDPPDAANEGPATFTATLSPEGQVQLRGRVTDARMNETLENFAHAQFGAEVVRMGTRIVEDLPTGWSVRMLAAVDALSELSNGAVVVTPDLITVRGNTGSTEANGRISRLLIERLGEQAEFEIEVTYVEALDPIAGLPTPEECVDKILGLTADRKIIFDPGSATLSEDSGALLDDIADILRRCADLRLEIAGYTDSQGRDSMNLELSQQRANSVLAALRDRRVPVGSFEAVGYGEADPIADNDTEEGREANRRIEFRLITPDPVEEIPTGLEAVESDLASEIEGETVEETGDEAGGEADAAPSETEDTEAGDE